jgi:hypothetical protein
LLPIRKIALAITPATDNAPTAIVRSIGTDSVGFPVGTSAAANMTTGAVGGGATVAFDGAAAAEATVTGTELPEGAEIELAGAAGTGLTEGGVSDASGQREATTEVLPSASAVAVC